MGRDVPGASDAPAHEPGTRPMGRGQVTVLLVAFFVSGFAALVYQVLWVRELGLLFGSTAQAAALTIAIFFAGIAGGGWYWGRRAPTSSSSLWWFGLLEIGVAATALGFFVLVDAYHALYPLLFGAVGHVPALDTLAKATVAAIVLLPPSFLMGGTLPLMGHHLVRDRERLGTTGSALYAVNTFGSAAGALAAGFVLPLALGFRGAYLLAVVLDLAVGVTACLLARRHQEDHRAGPVLVPVAPATPPPTLADTTPTTRSEAPSAEAAAGPVARRLASLPRRAIWLIAFASGVATLAIEVVWTRLFAQVLQNSVYTYALVLSTFLLALAIGSVVANVLSRWRRVDPEVVLGILLLLSGVATAMSPWLFFSVTDGLAYVGSDLAWGAYVAAVAGLAAIVMLLPGIVLGAVLPFLLRTLEGAADRPGETIGRLIAANTAGGILGSLGAGFVLLPLLGAWRSLVVLAGVYPVLVLVVAAARSDGEQADPDHAAAPRTSGRRAGLAVAAALGLGVLVTLDVSGLQSIRLAADGSERVVEVREGTQATVAVVADRDDLVLRVNNFYTLGGTRGLDSERNQTVVPMLAHADPAEVFYVGMGTGLTAGASLHFPVERVVVCELVDDVVGLAGDHFGPWTNGLFDDERVTVFAEDGRTCLRRSDDRYDLIISDLFTPWKAGTGNLYTLDHYETARDRLRDGGVYVQWMPLYQVSDRELSMVARTMDEAFEQVTMWRGDLFADRSIVALVGQSDDAPLDPEVFTDRGRDLSGDELSETALQAVGLRMYVGNVTASGIFGDAPINTDAYPYVEYESPRTHREVRGGDGTFLTGEAREELYDRIAEAVPPASDPYLAALDDTQLDAVRAGQSYSRYRWLDGLGRDDEARPHLDDFLARSPEEVRGPGDVSPARRLLPPILAPVPRG